MRNALACFAALSLALGTGAAPAQDWAGYYGGLSGKTHSGANDHDDGGVIYDLEGPAFGVFAGYRWASGNLVYGGEVAASRGGVYEVSEDGDTSFKGEWEYTSFLDLKGRLGYTFKGVLLYGTLGVSRGRFLSNSVMTTDTTGTVVGVGADYNVSDRFFLGAEYLHRRFNFYEVEDAADIDGDVNSLGIRLGVKF